MRFTFRKAPLDSAMLGCDGREANPYKAVEFVILNDSEDPLEEAELLEFIEENYPTLLALCTEAHQAYLAENSPKVVH